APRMKRPMSATSSASAATLPLHAESPASSTASAPAATAAATTTRVHGGHAGPAAVIGSRSAASGDVAVALRAGATLPATAVTMPATTPSAIVTGVTSRPREN